MGPCALSDAGRCVLRGGCDGSLFFFVLVGRIGGDIPIQLGDIGEFDPLVGAVFAPLYFGEDVGVLGAPGEFTAQHLCKGAFFIDEDCDFEVFLGWLKEEGVFVFEVGDVALEVVAAFDADVETAWGGMVGLDELKEPVVLEFDEGNPVEFEAGLGLLDHDGDREFPVGAGYHKDGLHASADFGVWVMTDEAEVGDWDGRWRELAIIAFDMGVHLFVFGAEDEFAFPVECVGIEKGYQGICSGFRLRRYVGDSSKAIGGSCAGVSGVAARDLHETCFGWLLRGEFAWEGRNRWLDDFGCHWPGIWK